MNCQADHYIRRKRKVFKHINRNSLCE